jgi:MYXO-CTERM domain-containing protein
MEFQMRNKTFISSMVGIAATAAVAGSAMAGTVVVDNFTAGSFNNTASGVWTNFTNAAILPLSGSNNTRSTGVVMSLNNFDSLASSTATFSGGTGTSNVSLAVGWGNFSSAVAAANLNYGRDGQTPNVGLSPSSVDLTSFTGLTVFGSGNASYTGVTQITPAMRLILTLRDNSGQSFQGDAAISAGALGNISFDFSTVTGVNMTSIRAIELQFNLQGGNFGGGTAGSGSLNYSLSSVQLVPAPGALALLGVAGLAGGRRRRA